MTTVFTQTLGLQVSDTQYRICTSTATFRSTQKSRSQSRKPKPKSRRRFRFCWTSSWSTACRLLEQHQRCNVVVVLTTHHHLTATDRLLAPKQRIAASTFPIVSHTDRLPFHAVCYQKTLQGHFSFLEFFFFSNFFVCCQHEDSKMRAWAKIWIRPCCDKRCSRQTDRPRTHTYMSHLSVMVGWRHVIL